MKKLATALERLREGKLIILVDDEDRENEGDLVQAASLATAESINFMATHGRGLICLSLEAARIEALRLPMMTARNRSPRQTAFTISIEAASGVTTGISAADRARTIQAAMDPMATPEALVSPGHVFPLKAAEGGTLVRAGHTEGSLDLMKMAGLPAGAVICEVMNEDGTMARLPELRVLAEKHGLPIVSIQDVIAARMEHELLVEAVAQSRLPTPHGEFELHAFRSRIDGSEHVALVKRSGEALVNPVLVRVHSECLTGDALGSLRCDCGAQLQASLRQIAREGAGVLVYMRAHEGRGIGLANKVRAYALQDQGMDTVEANRHLGFQADLRQYGLGAQILKTLGVRQIRLLTNNPRKVVGLEGYGLQIVERVSIQAGQNPHNHDYLSTKRTKLGHELTEGPA